MNRGKYRLKQCDTIFPMGKTKVRNDCYLLWARMWEKVTLNKVGYIALWKAIQ